MKTLHMTVSGIVQGVGFRYFVYRTARDHQISGWVRNAADGTVEILAQGEESHLNGFMQTVRIGPRFASVKGVKVEEVPEHPELQGFEITY